MLTCKKEIIQTLYFCSRHCQTYFKLFSDKIFRTPSSCLFFVSWVRGAKPTFALNLRLKTFSASFFWFKLYHGFELSTTLEWNIWFALNYVFWCDMNAQFSGLWFSVNFQYGLWALSDLWINCVRYVRALEQSFVATLKNESVFGQTCVFRNSRLTFLSFNLLFGLYKGVHRKFSLIQTTRNTFSLGIMPKHRVFFTEFGFL